MNKSSYYEFTKEGFNKRMSSLKAFLKDAEKNVKNLHISISVCNTKLGAIPSVSLLPVIDCGNCKACKLSCYDLRHDLMYKECKSSRAKNSAIYAADPERYFREIDAWLTLNYPRAFRWHIGGDIKGGRVSCRYGKDCREPPRHQVPCLHETVCCSERLSRCWWSASQQPQHPLQRMGRPGDGEPLQFPHNAPSLCGRTNISPRRSKALYGQL